VAGSYGGSASRRSFSVVESRSPDGSSGLVAAAAAGDADAWSEIVERYTGMIQSICRRLGLSSADTGDVSQSVWLRLVEHLPYLRDPQALPGWLATTTRNEALRVCRSGPRQPVGVDVGEMSEIATEESGPLDTALTNEWQLELVTAVRKLSPRNQRLLRMLLDGRPYADVARDLGMPIGSIGVTRRRILERLRQHLAEQGWVG
jgi:RNA polymerase sigma factor (sigma-70 family)